MYNQFLFQGFPGYLRLGMKNACWRWWLWLASLNSQSKKTWDVYRQTREMSQKFQMISETNSGTSEGKFWRETSDQYRSNNSVEKHGWFLESFQQIVGKIRFHGPAAPNARRYFRALDIFFTKQDALHGRGHQQHFSRYCYIDKIRLDR